MTTNTVESDASLGANGRTGSKAEALQQTRNLLQTSPALAIQQAQIIIEGDPQCAEAHRLLAFALRKTGRAAEARDAADRSIELSSLEKPLFQATIALAENRIDEADEALRPYLKEHPDDPVALRLAAEVAARVGKLALAAEIAARAAIVAPEWPELQQLVDTLKGLQAKAAAGGSARASTAIASGESLERLPGFTGYEQAHALYAKVVEHFPDSTENWVSYGHILRTLGEQDEAVAAYRRAIEIQPTFGQAWWALADLKNVPFKEEDVATLERLLGTNDFPDEDRIQMLFTLGRVEEQRKNPSAAFDAYKQANELRTRSAFYDPGAITRHVDKSLALFDRQFFDSRKDAGFGARDPIFILGLPRSGSTLLEQILSCHPLIEGTMELSDIQLLADRLAEGSAAFSDSNYLDKLAALDPTELQRFGQSYIWSSGFRRITDRPFFIDKMPNNWLHIGLILSILPNARIIDARRHPLDCGLSNYRQFFAASQEFTYNLEHIGRFYSDYVRMMAHFDEILPGRIHRVIHEQLIDDPETEVRRLLDYVGVDFNEACLRFHESKRAVRTASSEQVRRPINRQGVDQWRAFEPWLGELKSALGEIATAYPDVPKTPATPQ